jgi:hypothetical protein
MSECSFSILILSNIALVHLVACIVYMLISVNLDTPFKNSLSEEQKKIKHESAKVRRKLYTSGLFLGMFVVYFINPLSSA